MPMSDHDADARETLKTPTSDASDPSMWSQEVDAAYPKTTPETPKTPDAEYLPPDNAHLANPRPESPFESVKVTVEYIRREGELVDIPADALVQEHIFRPRDFHISMRRSVVPFRSPEGEIFALLPSREDYMLMHGVVEGPEYEHDDRLKDLWRLARLGAKVEAERGGGEAAAPFEGEPFVPMP